MITFASFIFFAQFRIGNRWLVWPFPLALALSSSIAQLITLTGFGGIRIAGIVLLALAALVWAFAAYRQSETPLSAWLRRARFEIIQAVVYFIAGGIRARIVAAILLIIAIALFVDGFLYLPLPVDDYNAIHSELIARHDSLDIGPTLNWTIAALGFLYEYIVADISLIPGIGNLALSLFPAMAWTAFALILVSYARRNDPDRVLLPVWAALAALPMIIWSAASLYKNDLFTAALSFPPLWMLATQKDTDDPETQLLMGLFAGLAVAAKLSALVVPFTLVLFLPGRTGTSFILNRVRLALSAFIGMICGGLPFVYYRNWHLFGNPLGLLDSTHLATGNIADRTIGILRFASSILNPIEVFLVPLNIVPGVFQKWQPPTDLSVSRLSLSALFTASLLVYGYRLARGHARIWPGIVSLAVLVITALLNRDLAITQRYIIAPAILLMLEAARSSSSRPIYQGVVRSYSIVAMFVLVQSATTVGLLLDKIEFIRDRDGWYASLMGSIVNRIGLADLRAKSIVDKSLYLRTINDAARGSRHVANAAFEYYADLHEISYSQIFALQRVGATARAEWNLDGLEKYDLIIVDNDFSIPAPLAAWLKDRCQIVPAPVGSDLPQEPSIRGYKCVPRDSVSSDISS